jgi:hypothetical protein
MPIPARYLRLFEPELEPGERIVSAGNADLWLRYRRMALTDRRILVVERGGVRNPWGGRRVTSLPLTDVIDVKIAGNAIQQTITLRLRAGTRKAYALPSFSQGTDRFIREVLRAAGDGANRAATAASGADSSRRP